MTDQELLDSIKPDIVRSVVTVLKDSFGFSFLSTADELDKYIAAVSPLFFLKIDDCGVVSVIIPDVRWFGKVAPLYVAFPGALDAFHRTGWMQAMFHVVQKSQDDPNRDNRIE